MDNDERIDFSVVDRLANPEHLELAIAGVLAAAAPELLRRADARSPVIALARWSAPALAAAALIGVISLATLWRVERHAREVPLASVSDVLLPAPVSSWVSEDRAPSNSDLILAVEGESQ
jgi:hypothetical protein